jgi:hypothetical protein
MERLEHQLSLLPSDFSDKIKPFVENQSPITDKATLIDVWQTAVNSRKAHSDKQELIAEWTMSAGATSSLINEPHLQEIHLRFGELELPEAHIYLEPGSTIEDKWNQLAELIELAKHS